MPARQAADLVAKAAIVIALKHAGSPALGEAATEIATKPPLPTVPKEHAGSEELFRMSGMVCNDAWDAGSTLSGPSLGGSHGRAVANASLTCMHGPSGGIVAVTVVEDAPETWERPPLGSVFAYTTSFHDTMSSPNAIKSTGFTWVRGEVLGCGTLGTVYKALDQKTGRVFAVKEVRIDTRSKEDVKFKKELENEVSIYKDLSHPHIVSFLGFDEIESSLYIYLEYMAGGSVAQVLSQFGPLDESLVATYARELLEGLEYLHTRAPIVLHRDVKGANILVGLDCKVKLSDFGCSKRTADTMSRSLRGSIPWMAPEVINQSGGGRRSDIWSFGCVLIEMATARHPWGSFDNPMVAMMRIGMSDATPPIPDSLSAGCRDFIGKCTQRDKSLRPHACELLQHGFVATKDFLLSTM